MYLDPVKFQGDMANHEKMYFFSRDIIRVKNPLSTDFKFKYDSIWNTVKAGQTKDMERYLAIKYCTDMAQYIIGEEIAAQGERAVETYKAQNPQLLLDKYIENRMIWDKLPRIDDLELNTKIWKDLWLGVVEKYGEEKDEPQRANNGKLTFGSTLQEQLVDRFKNIFVSDTPTQEAAPMQPVAPETQSPPPAETMSVSDTSLASEVTQ